MALQVLLASSLICAGIFVCVLCFLAIFKPTGSLLNQETTPLSIDGEFRESDVDFSFMNTNTSLAQLANEFEFHLLSPEDQLSYEEAVNFAKANPPNAANIKNRSLSTQDEFQIKECGINAYRFEQDPKLGSPRFHVEDALQLNFTDNLAPYSTLTAVMNYPIPTKNRGSEVSYFEIKVFEYSNQSVNAHFAIGLVTKPYPNAFRLPGYDNFSLSYESTGNLKINKPLPTPLQQHNGQESKFNALVLPQLNQSDVVGFGVVLSTGTIFITRNGKKLIDVMTGCFLDLYPAIGCFSANAIFNANLGQLGFLWIDANVKKYGFFSLTDRYFAGQRGLASLPEYSKMTSKSHKLLDKGLELPPTYPSDEIDFFGRQILKSTSKECN